MKGQVHEKVKHHLYLGVELADNMKYNIHIENSWIYKAELKTLFKKLSKKVHTIRSSDQSLNIVQPYGTPNKNTNQTN